VKTPRPVEEHPTAPEEIGGAASEQQEASEDQRVTRDRPADVRAAQLQISGDVGESDIHGSDVEDDHQLGNEQHREKPALRRGDRVFPVDCDFVLGVFRLVMHGCLSPSKLDVTV